MNPGATICPDGVELTVAAQAFAHGDDPSAPHGDVGPPARRPRPVDDGASPDDDVPVHLSPSSWWVRLVSMRR